MKLYLAHPILSRKKVREIEKRFEEELFKNGLKIELINPFYEAGEKEDIAKVDEGEIDEWSNKLPATRIVEGDLNVLAECGGVFAYIEGVPTIGTYMEILHNYILQKQQNKGRPLYILAPNGLQDAWLEKLSLRTFRSLEDAIGYFKQKKKEKSFVNVEEINKTLKEIEEVDCVIGYIDENRTNSKVCMIVFYAAYHLKKPTYIFSKKAYGHPWLRYLTRKSGGKIIRNFKELLNLLDKLSLSSLKVYFA